MRLVVVSLLFLLLAPVAFLAQPQPRAKPLSFAILEDYDKGEDLSEISRDFDLFDELDIREWRGSFGWDDYEPQPGAFDFEWLHRFVELAARREVRLRPYLAYTPEWAGARGSDAEAWNDPPRWLSDWTRFAGGVAGALRRHPNVLSFEIYNEQNVKQWWDSSAARYADVMTSGSRAIREANPGARVLFGGLVFPDTAWMEEVCAAPGARNFDVLPVHAYPETWTPPGVTVENYLDGLNDFAEAADLACGAKPIWINEAGFATVPGRSEHEQASWWVRTVATFAAHPRVEHIGVYEIKDLKPDRPAIGDTPNYHLGLTRSDRSPKLAFRTVDMLTDLLDAGTIRVLDGQLRVAPANGAADAADVHAHLFERPDRARVLVTWTTGAPARVRLEGVGSGLVTEFALDGTPQPRGAARGLFLDLELAAGTPRVFSVSAR